MKYSTGPNWVAQVICSVQNIWKRCSVTTEPPALNTRRYRWRGRTATGILIHSIAVRNQPLFQVAGQLRTPTNFKSKDTISVIIRVGRPGRSERVLVPYWRQKHKINNFETGRERYKKE
jgi:hypothetical protein